MGLPPELQAHVAAMVQDAASAGRFSRASHGCRLLLQERLAQLLEARRLRWQLAVEHSLRAMRRGSTAALNLYLMSNGMVAIHVDAHDRNRFTCQCCGITYQSAPRSAHANLQRHLLSKTHWTAYRQMHGLDHDEDAWHSFAASM